MQFTHVGGRGASGPGWLSYVLIAILVLSPVVVGLGWRLLDARRARRSEGSTTPGSIAMDADRKKVRTRVKVLAALGLGFLTLVGIGFGDPTLADASAIAATGIVLSFTGVRLRL